MHNLHCFSLYFENSFGITHWFFRIQYNTLFEYIIYTYNYLQIKIIVFNQPIVMYLYWIFFAVIIYLSRRYHLNFRYINCKSFLLLFIFSLFLSEYQSVPLLKPHMYMSWRQLGHIVPNEIVYIFFTFNHFKNNCKNYRKS